MPIALAPAAAGVVVGLGAFGMLQYEINEQFRAYINRQIPSFVISGAFQTFLKTVSYGRYFQLPWLGFVAGLHLYDAYPDEFTAVATGVKEALLDPVADYNPSRAFQFEWM